MAALPPSIRLGNPFAIRFRNSARPWAPFPPAGFFLSTPTPIRQASNALRELIADPVVESAKIVASAPDDTGRSRIEIHLKPGVMDPVAASDRDGPARHGHRRVKFAPGGRISSTATVPQERIAGDRQPGSGQWRDRVGSFRRVSAGRNLKRAGNISSRLRHVADAASRRRRLAKAQPRGASVSLAGGDEGDAGIFREPDREPTDIELETIAQTWSEHCVHKTLKSAVDVEIRDEAGKVSETRRYRNLIKETIFASTMQLMRRSGANAGVVCLSVFADNAGVIALRRNRRASASKSKPTTTPAPSNRTAAAPPASAASSATSSAPASPPNRSPIPTSSAWRFPIAKPPLPKGIIHPKRILQQVVAGVRDYGNRMGIPTVNGAVYFDDRYLGNPLVFCGCVGLIPRDKIHKETGAGDAIVVMGGRTGRDGIHGATFSSAELTDTHADEFSHAVQIGNAITEKKVGDVILQARDRGLIFRRHRLRGRRAFQRRRRNGRKNRGGGRSGKSAAEVCRPAL